MDHQNIGLLIAELGFPIVMALAAFGALWWTQKFVMASLHRDIEEVKSELVSSQQAQYEIIVKLIDRVSGLSDGVLRTEIICRTAIGLEQEWNRIGMAKGGRKKD